MDKTKQESFIFQTIRTNELIQWENADSLRMLFLKKGNGSIRYREGKECPLRENECILINKAEFYSYTFCELVIWQLNDKFVIQDRIFLRTLQPQRLNILLRVAIPIKPVINNFFKLLLSYKQDGAIKQDVLDELKQRELILLFRYYYDPEELSALFNPLLWHFHDFRGQILEHFDQVKNTGELIQQLRMKRTTFEKKFRQHFGTSAHQWLLQRKAEKVYQSLQEEHYSLREIRKLYRFNSSADFVRFCRRWFGAPPTQVRKQTGKKEIRNIQPISRDMK